MIEIIFTFYWKPMRANIECLLWVKTLLNILPLGFAAQYCIILDLILLRLSGTLLSCSELSKGKATLIPNLVGQINYQCCLVYVSKLINKNWTLRSIKPKIIFTCYTKDNQQGVSGLATDSPCGVWGRGWTTCLLHDSPLFGSHFQMRVGMYVWSEISYIY